MKYVVSYKIRKNGKWSYRRNKIITKDELDVILSDPDCILINGGHA